MKSGDFMNRLKVTCCGLIAASMMSVTTTLAEPIPIRGVVEGFYGTPWTHEDRIDMFDFCNTHALNAYIYAPKDDPYHRAKWREPYPDKKLEEIKFLIDSAKKNNIRFIFAVSPGLDLNYGSPEDLNAMIQKLTTIYNLGVHDFAIFFDDIEDKDGGAQAQFLNTIEEKFINLHQDISPLITVPTEYFRLDMIDENGRKPYTVNFLKTLSPSIMVLYTGEGVVQPKLTDEQYELANGIYERNLGIWWNYPVNDYSLIDDGERNSKLALGAIDNLPKNSNIPAIFFNPMQNEQLSKIALATGADYANDPEHYNALSSWNKAIDEQFGNLSAEMKLFADHSQHLENNWANIGNEDGQELRTAMNKLLHSNDDFNDNLQNVKNQLQYLRSAVKKLQKKLPQNILEECKPQLEQFERIINADFIALDLLKSKRDNNVKQTKKLEALLKSQREEIKIHEKIALISDITCRAFIDEVLNE